MTSCIETLTDGGIKIGGRLLYDRNGPLLQNTAAVMAIRMTALQQSTPGKNKQYM